jgi:hypothetical protein
MWKVTNRSRHEAYVAMLYRNEGCGTKWAKKGWWHLNPGETKTILGSDMRQDTVYYLHAHTPNGLTWGTEATRTPCPSQAFNWCDNVSSTSAKVRSFYEVYSNTPNHTSYLN